MQSRYKKLFDKSVSAILSAIELYNKPDFKYREESFAILIINGWELLLKSKMLKENNNKLICLYHKIAIIGKNGKKTKKMEYAKNRSGTNCTISIDKCIIRLEELNFKLDSNCLTNIEAMVEIRDNAIHFCNSNKLLNKKIQELGTASLKNYLQLVKNWFDESLENFNFYLMPMSFFNNYSEVDGINLNSKNNEIKNLTKYLAEKEANGTFSESNEFHISVKVDLKLVKSDTEGSTSISYSKDKNSPNVYISEEDITKNFPLEYYQMYDLVKSKIPNFQQKTFFKLKLELENNKKICRKRYLNPYNKNNAKKMYNNNFVDQLVKKYNDL